MADFADALALQIPRLRRYACALTHDASWADDLVQGTLERALWRRWLFRINTNLTAWLLTILWRIPRQRCGCGSGRRKTSRCTRLTTAC